MASTEMMSAKREHDDVDDSDSSVPQLKRSKRQNQKHRLHQNSDIDPTWGQKYVFGGSANATTVPIGEESEFEDDSEAMAYLMSVRQEAGTIPHLLVAPKVQIGPQLPAGFPPISSTSEDKADPEEDAVDRSIYEQGVGDSRGYYQDGAYVAAPEEVKDNGLEVYDNDYEVDGKREELYEAYFASLMNQYHHLRSIVNSTPPPDASQRFNSSHPAKHGSSSTASNKFWAHTLRNTDPLPVQLALMSKETVLRVLHIILGGKFLRRGYPLPERTSRWLWGLLARLPERGELNHLEIGWVRDLGRRAVLLGRSLAEMAALREELADGGLGVNEGVDQSSTDEDAMVEGDAEEPDAAESLDDVAKTTDAGEPGDPNETEPKEEVSQQEAATAEVVAEEGEIEEDDDVAMDIVSDAGSEEGEAQDEPETSADGNGLEGAKTRLLAQLDHDPVSEEEGGATDAATERSRMNMRATLNMILCVAGEFYGQRDLLEFRDPFVGM